MRSVANLLRLEGRVAIITGGTGHLGLACAEALAENGASVVLVDRVQKDCDERAKQLADTFKVQAFGLAVDLADASATAGLVSTVQSRLGRLDVLVNNAAFTGASGLKGYAVPFAQQTAEAWQAALQVNLTAPFVLTQAAGELLKASGHGTVLNVGSIYGVVGPDLSLYAGTPMGNPAAYGASKGGLLQLTRYLATVMAPAVRVNCLSPGGIARGQPDEFAQRYRARTPLGRMATEEDFKGAVAFLCSDASAYVTGQNLCVDGGWTAW
jgi:NAD(P)-dependent dehydrogenase (short-subunit alcohol dehydrogenase family)